MWIGLETLPFALGQSSFKTIGKLFCGHYIALHYITFEKNQQ